MIRRKRTVNYLIGGLGALALITGGFFYLRNQRANPLDKYLTVKADRGSVKRTVSSTGTLQAVITVQVGSQVSGRIQELHADFNSVVKKGQILAVVDPANFQAQQDRAQAGLATALAAVKNAEANVNNRRADLLSMKASLEVAKVALRDADRQYKRAQGLLKDGLISDRDLESCPGQFRPGNSQSQPIRGPGFSKRSGPALFPGSTRPSGSQC